MYSVTMKERFSATQAKLEATERLLKVEQDEHEITRKELAQAREVFKREHHNTGVYFDALHEAEVQLERIAAILREETGAATLQGYEAKRKIWEVLNERRPPKLP